MGMNIAAIPSYTNFIFFPLGKYTGSFEEEMFNKKVILHSYKNPEGDWARVSVGTMDEMKQFITLLKADWKS
jgi:histidinol-phosphate aminotransferase